VSLQHQRFFLTQREDNSTKSARKLFAGSRTGGGDRAQRDHQQRKTNKESTTGTSGKSSAVRTRGPSQASYQVGYCERRSGGETVGRFVSEGLAREKRGLALSVQRKKRGKTSHLGGDVTLSTTKRELEGGTSPRGLDKDSTKQGRSAIPEVAEKTQGRG